MFSIIETGGKQYKVSVGNRIKVEYLEGEEGSKIIFDKVLLMSSDNNETKIGEPYISGAKVSGEIINQGRDKKKISLRYKPKKGVRVKRGHKQPHTEIKITEIE
ncbi:MAG: 50S ribosomal protein L21 [Patescibacteria group bacterium]